MQRRVEKSQGKYWTEEGREGFENTTGWIAKGKRKKEKKEKEKENKIKSEKDKRNECPLYRNSNNSSKVVPYLRSDLG